MGSNYRPDPFLPAKRKESMYGTCEEAAEAGEEGVQRSQGGREKPPNEVVPGAGDAEGYGVVCEEYDASETLTHRTHVSNLVTKCQGGGP